MEVLRNAVNNKIYEGDDFVKCLIFFLIDHWFSAFFSSLNTFSNLKIWLHTKINLKEFCMVNWLIYL